MIGLINIFRSFHRWGLHREGSTRASALIRIGLVFLLWSRYAGLLLFYKDLSWAGFLLSFNFYGATTLMLLGCYTRFSSLYTAVVLGFMYFYFGLSLGHEPWTHHHNYLMFIAICCIALTPSGRSFSVDRYRVRRRARREGRSPPEERGNLWGLSLIVVQLSAIYFFSALDKCNGAFLSGDRMEHYLMWYYLGSDFPSWTGFHEIMGAMAWGTVALEFCLAIFLPFRATRRFFLVPGLVLHGLFFVLLPVRTYSLTMILLYLAYLDPERVAKVTTDLVVLDTASPKNPALTHG